MLTSLHKKYRVSQKKTQIFFTDETIYDASKNKTSRLAIAVIQITCVILFKQYHTYCSSARLVLMFPRVFPTENKVMKKLYWIQMRWLKTIKIDYR